MEKVFLIKTRNRTEAIQKLTKHFDMADFKGKNVALKANFNSADPFPALTHIETLGEIVKELKTAGAKRVTLAERSGMGQTRNVLEQMGVLELAKRLDFDVVVLDEVGEEGWLRFKPSFHNHWRRGFEIARVFINADRVVQTCCLKTHRFGGHFTLSLKNSVGLIARYDTKDGYDYMEELHSSPHQRRMIAEVNAAYKPDLIIMDGIEAFVNGGPEAGEGVSPSVLLAAQDRVAIDAVGVAILRHFGTTRQVSEGRIFEQQQIARAAELDVGVHLVSDIELVPIDEESRKFADDIGTILKNEG